MSSMFAIPSSKYLGHFASRFFGAGYGPQTDSFDYGPTGPSSGFPFILKHMRKWGVVKVMEVLTPDYEPGSRPLRWKSDQENVNDPTENSMMILNMVSLLQNGGDYKDFYKSGKKEDFASFDEYWNVS